MHDLVLSGGHVVDGTGGPPFRADVAVSDGRIAALGHAGAARRVVDVSGYLVAPGFVDMHSHSDLALLAEPTAEAFSAALQAMLADRAELAALRQRTRAYAERRYSERNVDLIVRHYGFDGDIGQP